MAKVTIKRRNESERADGRAALYAVLNIERIKIRLPLDIAVTGAEWDPVENPGSDDPLDQVELTP